MPELPPAAGGASPDRDDAAPASSQTVPDPSSPLRQPDAAVLPEPVVGEGTADRVIQGHTYDGIREYDNPMPGWWVGLFWVCVLFAPVYLLGVHVFGFIDDYGDDFAEAGEQLAEVRAVYAATGPAFKTDEGALREYAQDPAFIEAGAVTFSAVCAACHGAQGEGTIGPNLTDEFWIHGAEPTDVYRTISQGVLDKGMPAWDGQLSEEEQAQAMAYVLSLQGTDPPNPKAPQGERAL